MLLDYQKYIPIKITGYFFICFSLFAVFFFREALKESGFRDFLIITITWYFLMGLGLTLRKIWGYYLFVAFLYLSYPGFPIGTLIAYKGLKYIKENDIKSFFNNSLQI